MGKNTSQKPLKVDIFIDIQNVPSIQKQPKLLIDFAKIQGNLDCQKLYFNPQYKNQVSAAKKLEFWGFQAVTVLDGSKNSADRWLCFDVVKRVACQQSPDIFILVLGDRDFAGLISILVNLGKKVIIFAQRHSASQKKLAKLVGDENFHYADELPSLVAGNTESKMDSAPCNLTYTEAVEYLLETIKTCLNQGKRAGLGFINRQMCKLFPNYQGVTSICKHDGKAFSRFSTFVKAVEKDGKVRIENQELFLT
ncbi:hypothetical protein BCD67_17140 [Oscillatoriales cyanobacterium USR001]|nr:hypothetical protein BCD67_17140 [Oscillatoriales cyanobacterium USR001]